MAVPRSRLSNARKNNRRAHDAKQLKPLSLCSNCKSATLPHRMCLSCGYYKGRSYKTKNET